MQLQDKGGISLSSAEEWQQATAIFESFTDGFITLDHEWCITYLNLQKHSNVSGKATEHLLGRRMWDVFPEAPGTIFEQQCREAAEKRVNVSFEVYYPPTLPAMKFVSIHQVRAYRFISLISRCEKVMPTWSNRHRHRQYSRSDSAWPANSMTPSTRNSLVLA